MPLSLSPDAVLAKNAIADDGAFIFFIEVTTNAGDVLRFVKNNEQLTWRGTTWEPLAVMDTSIDYDAKGRLPQVSLTLSNVSRIIQSYVENDIGRYGSGWKVALYLVYSENLDNDTPEMELDFEVVKVEANEITITFTLGVANPMKLPVPKRRVVPNTCQAIFKNPATGCTYAGTDTTCDKTLQACEEKFGTDAVLPFLGFPSMPSAVLRVKK